MKRVLAHALGCFVLGAFLVDPVWAQVAPPETIVCSNTETPGTGRCPALQTVVDSLFGKMNDTLAPTAYSTNRSASLSGNSVSMLGDIPGLVQVYGAYNLADSEGVGSNEGNAVFIEGSNLNNVSVCGGYSDTGNAMNNSASIADSKFSGDASSICGGYSDTGNVTNNSTSIVDSKFSDAAPYIYGGHSLTNNATKNSLSISKIEISGEIPYLFGGLSFQGDVTNNSLSITDSEISSHFPYIHGGNSDSGGNATSNSVHIAKSEISGEAPYICGGFSYRNTTNNSLSIADSTISGANSFIIGGTSGFDNVTNNSVSIADSEISGESPYICGGISSSNNATNNSVKLSGTLKLGANALISGGNNDWNSPEPPVLACAANKDCFTGNTLVLDNYTEVTSFATLTVGHFASYSFLLSDASQPLMMGTVRFTPANGIPAGAVSAVSSISLAPGYTPALGTKISLLCAGTFEGIIANNGKTLNGSGLSFRLSQEADCIYATVGEISSNGGDSETTGNNAEAKSSGCGCTASGNTSFAGLGFVLSLALLARLRRRGVATR
ncbi:MAG: hypothetical protein FWD46_01090 [Cystobacterineae bacterium]|nr:hypothetical protein [Cystobacterineae bacterium]